MTSHSDFLPDCHDCLHEYGFEKATVVKLLAAVGIVVDGGSVQPAVESPEAAKPHTKTWDRGMYLRQRFTIDEAACIICDKHPDEREYWWGEPWPSDVSSMRRAIMENWHELDETFDGNMDNVQGDTEASHKAIARWCYSRDIHWPLMSKEQAMGIAGPTSASNTALAIDGATFAKLATAISAFPQEYPQYKSEPPKLDADVRKWLGTSFGCSEREKHVFGQIISEHFGLN